MTTATAWRRNHWANHVAMHGFQVPDRPALRWLGTTVTYGELADQVVRLANALSRRGIGFGDRIAIMTFNRPEFLVTTFAATRLGAVVVPINFRLTPGEVAYLLEDSTPALVVVDETLLPVVAAATPDRRPSVVVTAAQGDPPDAERFEDLLAEDGVEHEPVDVPEDSAAVIMYTSGTTGRPKGAVLTHVNLQGQGLSSIRFWRMWDSDTVYLLGTPLFHIGGLGSVIGVVMLGGCIVVQPTGAFDAASTLDLIATEHVTGTFLVPAQWQLLCDEIRAGAVSPPSLRTVCWGAAPATDVLLRRLSECFPQAHVVAVFGQTEMSPVTCVLEPEDAVRKLGSVGRPIATIAWRVVDDDMVDVAQGEVGEIVYRGPTQMAGYWRAPEATAEAFAGGWFHSGDLVRVDDEGFVYVVDRKKDMIISGGENVYCAEVENALADHDAIAEVSVIGRADERWGEVLVAVVVAADPDDPPDTAGVRDWAGQRLARFKLPAEVIVVEALPRNASGKVVKGALRERFATG